jgi:hypothetical protein
LIQAYELTKTAQTGILSNELILPARRLAQQFGVGPDQVATIADSQTYLTVMAPQVLKIVKELRPASNLDVDFAKAQAAGDLNLQAETLQRAIRLIGADTFRAAQAHQQNIGAARSAYPEQANTVNSYGIELPNLPAGWLEEMPNGQVGANLRVPGQAVPPKGPFQLDPETDAIMRRYLQPR